MRKIVLAYILFLWCGNLTYAQPCYPHHNGLYMYYANVSSGEVDPEMNVEMFTDLVRSSEYLEEGQELEFLNDITEATQSFPTAKTPLLQGSITIWSRSNTLDQELSPLFDLFNFVEQLCFPEEMLLYTPNDNVNNNYVFTHLDLVQAFEAWDLHTGDPRILIGITDTYIVATHEYLQSKIDQVLVNNSPQFHGTHVAGCAAAHTDNLKGIAATGFKSEIVFSSHWASDATVLAISQMPGVRVINCSWLNNCTFSTTQELVYNEVRDSNNVVTVAGAGNNSTHCSTNAVIYPAGYNSVMSVTSVGHINPVGYVDPIYGANNWRDCHEEVIGDPATTHHHNSTVDICAPGYNVLSTSNNNSYGGSWGTSFAAPMVAGACAVVAATNPCLTAAEIHTIMTSTADPSIYLLPENAPYIGGMGSGRLDMYQAVKKAIEDERVYVQNITYTTTMTETSETTVEAGFNLTNTLPFGNVVVDAGSDVTFEATHSIILSDGFIVENNANFEAKMYDSSCF
ncbi:MAG: S8/S53 family peptidase [Bacteroidota bacterium]